MEVNTKSLFLIIWVLALGFGSCKHSDPRGILSDAERNLFKPTQVRIDSSTDPGVKVDINVSWFHVSDCQEDCENEEGKIITNELIMDTLRLELGHWFNCSGSRGYMKEIIIEEDTLDIIMDFPHTEEHWPGGDIVIAATDCNCYYLVSLKYANIKSKPSTIRINSRKLENGYWLY